jgi:integrase
MECDAAKPSPMVIAEYIASIADRLRYSTIKIVIAAIAHYSRQGGFFIESNHPILRDTLRGIHRIHQYTKCKAMALGLDDVRRIIATCEPHTRGVRDRALILIGFAGAFRRTELVAIDMDHLRWMSDGIIVHVPRSKEDQEGKGESVVIPYGHDTTCPIRALEMWLILSGITKGPVFRSITKAGFIKSSRLIEKQVNHVIIARAQLAGIVAPDDRRISSHGLRAGFVTEAFRAGVSDEAIMGHTRHRSRDIMRDYVRREVLAAKDGSPAGKIGL